MEREIFEVDILCVGAGVASLSTALRLLRQIERAEGAKKDPPSVMIIEKGRSVGAHALSGAVLDTASLSDILTDDELENMPIESRVTSEKFYRLTRKRAFRLPFLPPMMRAKGFPIISLSMFTKWLGELCEAAGAEVYTELAATELLEENGRIVGARLGDKGIDKNGEQKSTFEPGPDVKAKVVILGEGAHGVLTEKLIEEKGLDKDANSQAFAIGIKEVIEGPASPDTVGRIIHTFGYPLDCRTYGGGFVYRMNDTQTAVGLVVALDYMQADLDPHELFKQYKAHPVVMPCLKGGKVVEYGAKALPEAGYFAVPALVSDGVMIVGDGAGLLDSIRLKGIHLAVQSGISAGDTLFDCWKNDDWSEAALEKYPQRFHATPGWRQLKKIRNSRACFEYGMLPGIIGTGMSIFTGGLLPPGRFKTHPDYVTLKPLKATHEKPAPAKDIEAALQLDRLDDVYFSGTEHEEDQPCHVKIKDPKRCIEECLPKYGAPCILFCPGQVYELSEDKDEIKMQPSNCLHCKTCQNKDPLQNIEWTFPDGGGGPRYRRM